MTTIALTKCYTYSHRWVLPSTCRQPYIGHMFPTNHQHQGYSWSTWRSKLQHKWIKVNQVVTKSKHHHQGYSWNTWSDILKLKSNTVNLLIKSSASWVHLQYLERQAEISITGISKRSNEWSNQSMIKLINVHTMKGTIWKIDVARWWMNNHLNNQSSHHDQGLQIEHLKGHA